MMNISNENIIIFVKLPLSKGIEKKAILQVDLVNPSFIMNYAVS